MWRTLKAFSPVPLHSIMKRQSSSVPEIACGLRAVALNANRLVTGVMRGFDQFMNIVLDNAIDERMKSDIGMVVRRSS